MELARRRACIANQLWLGAAGLLLASSCQSGTPANQAALGLTLVGAGVTGTLPNPCEMDVDFGDVATGQTENATLHIVNNSGSPVTLKPVLDTQAPAFTVVSMLPDTLQPKGGGDVALAFAPMVTGSASLSFSIRTTLPAALSGMSCPTLTISLSGTGVGLTVDPTSVDLGTALVGTTVQKTVTLTNQAMDGVSGLSASIAGADPSDFTVVGLPDSIDASASAQVSVQFHPQAQLPSSTATITFAGSAGQSATLNVSGEPIAAPLTLTPNPLDFGFAPPLLPEVACTIAANIANVPVTVTGIGGLGGSFSAFAVSMVDDATPPMAAPIPVTVQPGGSAELCFRLMPPVAGQYTGQVTLDLDQPAAAEPTLQLTGFGGGPQLSCAPTNVGFGQTLVGTTSTLPVVCTNTGSGSPPVNLTLAPSVSALPFGAAFDLAMNPYPLAGLTPGQSAQIDVTYHPTGGTTDMGTLTIASNGGRAKGLQIPLSGQGLSVPACRYVLSPTFLDFGNIALGAGSESDLSFWVQNVGTSACLVKDLSLQDATGSFRIVSASTQPDPESGFITLPPAMGAASTLAVDLAFSPADAGASSAEVDFWISDPAQTQRSVALRGTSGSPCLVVGPTALDFGAVTGAVSGDGGASCKSASLTISVLNQCAPSTILQAIRLQGGPGDGVAQFTVPTAVTTPLGPSDAPQTYSVTFEPTTLGTHTAQLVFSEATADTLVSLSGTAIAGTSQTDGFIAAPPKVDILFVRDIGDEAGSQAGLEDAMADFLDAGAGMNYRLAVTTVDDPRTPEPNYGGWLLPCSGCYATGPGPTIVTPTSSPDDGGAPDPATVVADLLEAGGEGTLDVGDTRDKHLLMALFQALMRDSRPGLGFFRPGALLAVVNESGANDADGSTVVHPLPWFQSFLGARIPDPALLSWSYLNPSQTDTGTGLDSPDQVPPSIETMVAGTGGLALNLEDANWPTAFLSLWAQVHDANLRYHLSSTPAGGVTGMVVSINGSTVPATSWTYDAAANAVVFLAGSAPKSGDQVQVTYPLGCF